MGARLKDMVHYVVRHTAPEKLGATKLNKVLWFADVMHYRLHGRSISGSSAYQKNHFGPTPDGINEVIAELKRDSSIAERRSMTPAGARREYVWLADADASAFTADEVDTIQQVIEWATPMTAKEISDLSHDALWEETELGCAISIAAASVSPSEPDEEDLAWARQSFEIATTDAIRQTA
ncbi:MAG: hypothetical protein RIS35_639 [Pseudomonadota bacterium]|jgi:hypothetical protein